MNNLFNFPMIFFRNAIYTLLGIICINFQILASNYENEVIISDLDLNLSIKFVKGSGERKVAYFFDPVCRYCKKFNKEVIKNLDNITIYNFILPIMSDESLTIADSIWCSDPKKNILKFLNGEDFSNNSNIQCNNPSKKIIELASKYNLDGIPSFIFEYGEKLTGYLDYEQFNELLETSTKKASHRRFLDNPPAYCGGEQMINH